MLVILSGLFAEASAQSISVLNRQREEAEREIKRIDSELSELKNSSADVAKRLSWCTKRLNKRREVLRSIDSQIAILDDSERSQSKEATAHAERLEGMREGFAASARKLYKLRSVSENSELWMSDSLQSRQVHIEHLTRILMSDIKAKSDSIEVMQGVLGEELRQIKERKAKLRELKEDEAAELKNIQREENDIKALQRTLGGKEKNLNAQKEAARKELDKLQEMIAAAIKAELEAQKKEEKGDVKYSSTDFEASMGKMISPLFGAKIIDSYGLHNHPTLSGVKVDNKGVNLKGRASGEVRVVCKGEVRKVFKVGGMGASILVRHGDYITVYSNLSKVSVESGQMVTSGDKLGEVGSDGMLHFEVWKETTTQNPTLWVKF